MQNEKFKVFVTWTDGKKYSVEVDENGFAIMPDGNKAKLSQESLEQLKAQQEMLEANTIGDDKKSEDDDVNAKCLKEELKEIEKQIMETTKRNEELELEYEQTGDKKRKKQIKKEIANNKKQISMLSKKYKKMSSSQGSKNKSKKTNENKKQKVKNKKTPSKNKSDVIVKSEEEILEAKRKRNALIAYVLAITAILGTSKLILDSQQKEIPIVCVNKDFLTGDIINSEDFLKPYNMLEREYNNFSKEAKIIKWEDRDNVIGKYAAVFLPKSQFLNENSITDKKVVRNPWLGDVDKNQEIYTLPIDTSDINVRMLLPGTSLRARFIVVPETEQAGDKQPTDSSESQKANETNEMDVKAVDETLISAGEAIPAVTIPFEDLTAVDLLNSNNESIFEIYMALLKMPVAERLKYLETQIIEEDAEASKSVLSFQERVTPTSLVLALSKEQATNMAKYENVSGVKIKYTILPQTKDEDKNELLSSFQEIANQLEDIAKKTGDKNGTDELLAVNKNNN